MRETRSFAVPLELRAGIDQRTVGGLVVPFDTPTEVRGGLGGSFTEVFRPGSFSKTLAERGTKVKLLTGHAHDRPPVGRATKLTETRAGVEGEFYVSKTQAGDEALELIRDGALDSFSVGFEPVKDQWSRDRSSVERIEARLWEVSLVAIPAYEGALVSSLRDGTGRYDPTRDVDWQTRRLAVLFTRKAHL